MSDEVTFPQLSSDFYSGSRYDGHREKLRKRIATDCGQVFAAKVGLWPSYFPLSKIHSLALAACRVVERIFPESSAMQHRLL